MLSNAFRYNAGLIRANGTPFFTGDGSTSSAQLVDRHGNPISSSKLQRLDEIHRTDWQGRQLLYPTPRTNYVADSTAQTWAISSGASVDISTGYVIPGGPTLAKMTGGTVGTSTCYSAYQTVAAGNYFARFLISKGGGQKTNYLIYNADTAVNEIYNAVTWNEYGVPIIAGTSTQVKQLSADSSVWQLTTPVVSTGGSLSFRIQPDRSVTHAVVYAGCAQLLDIVGVYIATEASAVTITDYSLSGSTVSFGEAPAGESSPGAGDAAVCDWTGVARR